METSKLRKFASFARKSLIQQVGTRMESVLADSSLARRENAKAVTDLEKAVKELGHEQTIELVAYTWFNRFCALRYMDVNRYTRIGVISPAEGQFQPEILAEAKMGHMDDETLSQKTQQKVNRLLDQTDPSDNPQGEAYRLLLVAVCNHYHDLMPFLFEKIEDYTELLLPDDLLSGNSILAYTREALLPINCSPKHTDESVEVIGWLYQFYISEKKDNVFAALKKGKKITPENIPAATQLFTPHWIVRYLVENSLGRLWMLNHPSSQLVEKMDYYIRPEVESNESRVLSNENDTQNSLLETDYLRISSPEEIRICDPACGSGHMLTYAFDLLYAIYEEQGYQATDIPRLILTHNLYGIEIDQRAGALAAFALTMKAREKDRRFFTRRRSNESRVTSSENQELNTHNSLLTTQPNICVLENISVDPEDLSAYMDKVGRDLFSDGLQGVVNQWEEADNFGSLIRPLVTDVSEALELLALQQMGEDLFLAGVHQKVLTALRQADYLSPKYHVIIANPPYMGSKGMEKRLKDFMKSEYKRVKSDTFAAFIIRCIELGQPKAQLGLVTPFNWMFLSSFEPLREDMLSNAAIESLVQLEFNAFGPAMVSVCAFTLGKAANEDRLGTFIRLSEFKGVDIQAPKTLEAIRDPSVSWHHSSTTHDFRRLPGNVIAYWLSENAISAFETNILLEELSAPKQGLATTDNAKFLRLWFELPWSALTFGCRGRDEAAESGRKWFPYNKGGDYRRWFGNNEYVVNWENDGQEIKQNVIEKYPYLNGNPDFVTKNQSAYFKESITWTYISAAYFGVRYSPPGFIFDVAGSSVFPKSDQLKGVLAFMSSMVADYYIKAINPTMNIQAGNVGKLPLDMELIASKRSELNALTTELCDIAKEDWDSFEVSWDFEELGLIANSAVTLEKSYQSLHRKWLEERNRVRQLELQNNTVFVDAYGLNSELSTELPDSEITLSSNPLYRYPKQKDVDFEELEALLLADTMREFISYAVGCMLGRYSLDKPGLILANQGETFADYVRIVGEYLVMSNEKEGKDGSEQLSGSDCVAEGDGCGGDDLSSDQAVSEGGDLRTAGSDSQSSSVHSVKHSGRSGAEIDGGLQEVPSDRSGLASGSGDSTSDRPASEIHNSGSIATDTGSAGRNLEDVKFASGEVEVTSNEYPVASEGTHDSLLNTQYSFLNTQYSFLPDEDNVIPLLDGDWFTDDISERFKEFLKVTFGTQHYEENLTFLENGLYPDNLAGKRRKTIRDYFLKDFDNHHIKLYKKRPIYWMFSSPKGTFNALIYMHRYRPDTVSTVLQYLRDFRDKLAHRRDHLQAVADSGSASQSDKTKAVKEVTTLKKQLKELEDYETETLFPLAQKRIEIDLDDGVKHNYPLFGKALKKVTGLSGK